MDKKAAHYKGIWTLAEMRDERIHPVSFEVLAWGRELADKLGVELTSIIIGANINDKVETLIHKGADRVYAIDNLALQNFRADSYCRILTSLINEYKPEIVLASGTTTGKTLMPLCATKLRTGLTTDCTDLDIDLKDRLLIQKRLITNGNIGVVIKIPFSLPQMTLVRSKCKKPLPLDKARKGEVIVKEFSGKYLESRVKRIEYLKEDTIGVPVQDADIVVSCGKGIKDAKNLEFINELATLLDGSVGASRKAVDQGWISYSHQIGLSGKRVSPSLYIACGISGAMQHLAGMSSAENIVAINSDPEANIFKTADFGVVGDLFQVIPLLIQELQQRQKEQ